MSKLTRVLLISLVVLLAGFGFAGCDRDPTPQNNDAPDASTLPVPEEPEARVVTTQEAEEAVGDAMLASALALFLALEAEPGATDATNPDGSLALAWDERADFAAGAGVYTITLTGFAVPADEIFANIYNGYTLNGTIVTGSTDGVSASMNMELTLNHNDPERYPVEKISLNLEDVRQADGREPEGSILINEREMRFADLASAFDLEP